MQVGGQAAELRGVTWRGVQVPGRAGGAHREVQYLEGGACLSYSYPEIRY